MEIILGSTSPRRREILNYFSLPHRAVSPSFDESSLPFSGDARAYVHDLARLKGESLKNEHPEALLITADTIVFLEGRVLGKPADRAEAMQMLQFLTGKEHQVLTAISLHYKGEHAADCETTYVQFHPLEQLQIEQYLDQLPYQDKAGSYLIQGAGSLIVKSIRGCYYNVVGFPVGCLAHLLKQFDLDLWKHLSPPCNSITGD